MKLQNGFKKFSCISSFKIVRYILFVFCVVLIGIITSACASTSAEENKLNKNIFVVMDSNPFKNTDLLSSVDVKLLETDADFELSEPQDNNSDEYILTEDSANEAIERSTKNASIEGIKPIESKPENIDKEESPKNVDDREDVFLAESQEETPFYSTTTITYTCTDENKTMYTTSFLNIRSGPSTNFDCIGAYTNGAEVTVTGICNETGWSRVNYNGSIGYCCSDYLTDINPIKKESTNLETSTTATNATTNINVSTETYTSGGFPLWDYSWHSGAYIGRIRIPSVGVNVGLYNTNAQSAIDAWDSAAIAYEWDSKHDIYEYSTIYCVDHNYQGFSAIANCTIGCVMYIDGIDGNAYKYVCDCIDYNGYNTGYGLNDSNGNTVNCTGGLWCYTCHDDSLSYVYMVHFVAV